MGATKKMKETIENRYEYDKECRNALIEVEKKYINLKKFTLKELKDWLGISGPEMTDIFIDIKDADALASNEEASISDCLTIKVYKGDENLYLVLSVWRMDYIEVELEIWTKEAHDKLKELITEIIKQA